jgi:hypothetical protein
VVVRDHQKTLSSRMTYDGLISDSQPSITRSALMDKERRSKPMALFQKFGRRHGSFGNHGGGARRVIIIEDCGELPEWMRRLEVLCRNHAIPVRTKYIGQSLSHSGQPMAVYACVCHESTGVLGGCRTATLGSPCSCGPEYTGTDKHNAATAPLGKSDGELRLI